MNQNACNFVTEIGSKKGMSIVLQVIFAIVLGVSAYLFYKRASAIRRNILLGKPLNRSDRSSERFALMARVALGQSKMMVRIVPGLLHLAVYLGFLLINLEVFEIVLDGLLGTHRVLAPILGGFYGVLTSVFEVFMGLVTVACIVFLIRRSGVVARVSADELKGFPKTDATIILVTEIVFMVALLFMNASDQVLQSRGVAGYVQAGSYPLSSTFLVGALSGLSDGVLIGIERGCWWFHILGIFAFLNYLPYSKHFHIMLAFPNVYFSKLEPKGQLPNNEQITKEVKLLMDPEAAYATPAEENTEPQRFGAKDVFDLTWKQLLEAYTCTECGRCTSVCPANITGKKLSPRKIMMATRDRIEEVGKVIDSKGKWEDDGKSLLRDYITEEELWACTTCNACAEACPVNIDPVSIIVEMRRYLVMEESKASESINVMLNNIQNNGAPWAFSPSDRANWTERVETIA